MEKPFLRLLFVNSHIYMCILVYEVHHKEKSRYFEHRKSLRGFIFENIYNSVRAVGLDGFMLDVLRTEPGMQVMQF